MCLDVKGTVRAARRSIYLVCSGQTPTSSSALAGLSEVTTDLLMAICALGYPVTHPASQVGNLYHIVDPLLTLATALHTSSTPTLSSSTVWEGSQSQSHLPIGEAVFALALQLQEVLYKPVSSSAALTVEESGLYVHALLYSTICSCENAGALYVTVLADKGSGHCTGDEGTKETEKAANVSYAYCTHWFEKLTIQLNLVTERKKSSPDNIIAALFPALNRRYQTVLELHEQMYPAISSPSSSAYASFGSKGKKKIHRRRRTTPTQQSTTVVL